MNVLPTSLGCSRRNVWTWLRGENDGVAELPHA